MKTFDEWSSLGYRIKRGSKAVGRNAKGVPLFDSSQVWRPGVFDTYKHWENDIDYDDPLTFDNWIDK